MSEIRWRATLEVMPCPVTKSEDGHYYHPQSYYRLNAGMLLETEKDAISHARQLRIAEIDRLWAEVNTLDARYDAIEDEEMAACLQREMRDTDHLDITCRCLSFLDGNVRCQLIAGHTGRCV